MNLYWVKQKLETYNTLIGKTENAGYSSWQLVEKRRDGWFSIGWDIPDPFDKSDVVIKAKLIDPDGKEY